MTSKTARAVYKFADATTFALFVTNGSTTVDEKGAALANLQTAKTELLNALNEEIARPPFPDIMN